MRFEEALKCMREGKKVKSPSNTMHPLFIVKYSIPSESTPCKAICFKYDGKIRRYSIDEKDIFAEDWEVVVDDNK